MKTKMWWTIAASFSRLLLLRDSCRYFFTQNIFCYITLSSIRPLLKHNLFLPLLVSLKPVVVSSQAIVAVVVVVVDNDDDVATKHLHQLPAKGEREWKGRREGDAAINFTRQTLKKNMTATDNLFSATKEKNLMCFPSSWILSELGLCHCNCNS